MYSDFTIWDKSVTLTINYILFYDVINVLDRPSWCHTGWTSSMCSKFSRTSPVRAIDTLPGLAESSQTTTHPSPTSRPAVVLLRPQADRPAYWASPSWNSQAMFGSSIPLWSLVVSQTPATLYQLTVARNPMILGRQCTLVSVQIPYLPLPSLYSVRGTGQPGELSRLTFQCLPQTGLVWVK